jgi:protein phosphatase
MAFQRTHTHPVLSLGIVRSFARSDIGLRRKVNQDAFLTDDTLGLYVVADGMGGHAAGEVAAREAVDTVYGMVKRGLETMPDLRGPLAHDRVRAACRLLEGAVQAATYMVFALAELDREKHGMGTTISAALVLGDFTVTAQVGDSRIYLLRDFRVTQLTEDHTLINWQIREGLITPDEAKRSPNKNVITRAVGNRDYVQVDTGPVSVSRGDRLLLCSDGLHGYLKENEIISIGSKPGEEAVRSFIDLANSRGGKDNITAVLVEVVLRSIER